MFRVPWKHNARKDITTSDVEVFRVGGMSVTSSDVEILKVGGVGVASGSLRVLTVCEIGWWVTSSKLRSSRWELGRWEKISHPWKPLCSWSQGPHAHLAAPPGLGKGQWAV